MKQLFFLFSFLCLGIVSMNGQLPDSGSTTFEGRVLDCTNDYSPLVGAKVTIYLHIDDFETGKDDVTVNSVTYTDENGFYSVTAAAALPDLRYYTITCEAEGYYTESKDVTGDYPSNKVNFYLYADMGYATIHGRVIDYFTKQPISGATIEFNSGSGISIFKKTVTSGDDGLWTAQLPVGYENYYEVHADGYQWDSWGHVITYIEDFDIEICPLSILVHLDGKVIDKLSKKPIVGMELSVRGFDEDYWEWRGKKLSTTTDSKGYYSCEYYHYVGTGHTAPSDISWLYMTWDDKTNEMWGISGKRIGGLQFDSYEGTYTGYGQLVIENDKPVIYHTLNIEVDKNAVSDDAGIVDGINTINTSVPSTKHYDVNGVEIASNAKGLHIVNGKKVVVK